MDLPVMPPVLPMLAKPVKGIPDPEKYGGLSFEPKWDGFRCLVFKDGDEVELASRNTKPLTRYFPEVVEACTVSGAADAMIYLLARDIPHLEQAIQRVRATAPIERTESAIVLSRLLSRPRL